MLSVIGAASLHVASVLCSDLLYSHAFSFLCSLISVVQKLIRILMYWTPEGSDVKSGRAAGAGA
jgi:hypothetical protein